ncbi:2-hydroxychromene-2-carboxylate isomerase [Pseudooceanicola sp. GBMRC 2024]|uniref:2-hydroxychromene-2-carboxylate isomerase n=1 Tax=Pseudooceanicola albus TaxID=2692189 RepID=A0A6L7G1V7_9RHOB|nr:DsbA family protein [Pseudooceanicola albus]MXN17889.1 2-hydroxychromene-2-carboxylate isomerase [Pseudooceanicola albus]
MTPKTVQYFYSLASPWSYLGVGRLIRLAEEAGLSIESVPISTFKDNGWVPLGEKPAIRQAYVMADLKRWATRLKVPMVLGADRPALANLAEALPMVWAAQVAGADALALSVALQKAYWEDCRDVGTAPGRIATATEAGFDGAALAALEGGADVAAQKARMFDRARAAGVFGSPTYVFEEEMFWGQDRLDFLAEAVAAQKALA